MKSFIFAFLISCCFFSNVFAVTIEDINASPADYLGQTFTFQIRFDYDCLSRPYSETGVNNLKGVTVYDPNYIYNGPLEDNNYIYQEWFHRTKLNFCISTNFSNELLKGTSQDNLAGNPFDTIITGKVVQIVGQEYTYWGFQIIRFQCNQGHSNVILHDGEFSPAIPTYFSCNKTNIKQGESVYFRFDESIGQTAQIPTWSFLGEITEAFNPIYTFYQAGTYNLRVTAEQDDYDHYQEIITNFITVEQFDINPAMPNCLDLIGRWDIDHGDDDSTWTWFEWVFESGDQRSATGYIGGIAGDIKLKAELKYNGFIEVTQVSSRGDGDKYLIEIKKDSEGNLFFSQEDVADLVLFDCPCWITGKKISSSSDEPEDVAEIPPAALEKTGYGEGSGSSSSGCFISIVQKIL